MPASDGPPNAAMPRSARLGSLPGASLLGVALKSPALLGLPAIIFVGVFAVYPLARFLFGAFFAKGVPTLLQFHRLFISATFWSVLERTLGTAILVSACCVLLAYPLAYVLTGVRGNRKVVLIGLIVLPYLTSVIVRTYAWAAILALEGPVNVVLVHLGLLAKPQLLGHSDFGTRIGMIHILLPVAALTLWSGLEKIPVAQRTVAESLGASRVQSFLTVYLPQSLGSAGAAASLVYILSLGAYVIPATLGGTRGLLFAQLVVDQATTLLNWNLSAAMAVIMLVAAAVPAALMLTFRRVSARLRRGRPVRSADTLAVRYIHPVLGLVPDRVWARGCRTAVALILAFLLAPELVVIAFSFGPTKQITFPPAYLTVGGYATTLADASWMQPLGRSLIYGIIDASLATLLGALAAYGFARGPAAWARIGGTFLVLPVVLPEIVIAISYFIFANRTGISGTSEAIVIGQAAVAIGLVTLILSTIVRQIDINLEYAALMCGASRTRLLWEIVLPLIAPGLVVGFVYGFLNAFDSLVIPLFIAGQNLTVPVRMFLSLQQELTSAPAVIASVMISFLAAGLAVVLVLARSSRFRTALYGGGTATTET